MATQSSLSKDAILSVILMLTIGLTASAAVAEKKKPSGPSQTASSCKSSAMAHASACKRGFPDEDQLKALSNCLDVGADYFRDCCNRTSDPKRCKAQTAN